MSDRGTDGCGSARETDRLSMAYYHADVFAAGPLTGNGLTVMVCPGFPRADVMQRVAAEMKQYETIFLCRGDGGEYDARIFATDGELPFAGHPVLGAAAVIRAREGGDGTAVLRLGGRRVEADVRAAGREYSCVMDQGPARLLTRIGEGDVPALIAPLGLSPDDLAPGLPIEVCTTGLAYLIIPLRRGIERAGLRESGYERLLARFGARFAYVLDVDRPEGRTWDDAGKEDTATGSAAGPAADYLIRHGLRRAGEELVIEQGRFTGRASRIFAERDARGHMLVKGNVCILSEGTFVL